MIESVSYCAKRGNSESVRSRRKEKKRLKGWRTKVAFSKALLMVYVVKAKIRHPKSRKLALNSYLPRNRQNSNLKKCKRCWQRVVKNKTSTVSLKRILTKNEEWLKKIEKSLKRFTKILLCIDSKKDQPTNMQIKRIIRGRSSSKVLNSLQMRWSSSSKMRNTGPSSQASSWFQSLERIWETQFDSHL